MSGRSADPRRVAYEVLSAVEDAEAYANLLLPVRLERTGLSGADAAFATELVYGTLRLRGYYERVVELAARRPASAIARGTLRVLLLGAHQLLGMRTPAHAAVDRSVRLQRAVAGERATGFVNAVLRAVGAADPEQWRARVADSARSERERRALLSAHPEWIVDAFAGALAAEGRAGELDELLEADNVPPRLNLALLPGVADEALLPPGAEPSGVSPVGRVLSGGDPAALVRASAGAIRVQDAGSQLVALTLARARPVAAGERWLDLCAGPGGKAALLGAEARLGGARLLANEAVPARAELVRRSVEAVEDAVELRIGDGRLIADAVEGFAPGGFDRILLDAPCTGLGALRRRPEARWRKSAADLAELTVLQGELLRAAAGVLAPGGLLLYATCSPHLAETRAAVDSALAQSGLRELDARAIAEDIAPQPLGLAGGTRSVQLWPHRNSTDAMFFALLTRG